MKYTYKRTLEIVLGTGLPLLGVFVVSSKLSQLSNLLILYPLMIATGWHIIAINDYHFKLSRKASLFNKKSLYTWIIPIIILILAFFFNKKVSLILFLIILNWDFYSIIGKRYWWLGLIHNFIGGFLHFMLGVMAISQDFNSFTPLLSYSLYCAFAMLGGGMHHDSYHFREDKLGNYNTGAVRFGNKIWWSLGLLPMLISQYFLTYTNKLFFISFTIPFVIYFILYIFFRFKVNILYKSSFRLICRTVFSIGGISYIVIKFLSIK